MGVSQNYAYHFGGPHNKDYNIFGSILGSPNFGKLPYDFLSLEQDVNVVSHGTCNPKQI